MQDDRIKDVLQAALTGYVAGSRQTGRTTRMLEVCNSGDVVICSNDRHADYIRTRAKQLGKSVVVVVMDTSLRNPEKVYRHRPEKIHFDHSWYEEYYENMIQGAAKELLSFKQSFEYPKESASQPNEIIKAKDWPTMG